MKKRHQKTLKFHTIYNVALGLIFITIILLEADIALLASMIFLFSYIVGNGIIHARQNELGKDTCLEYIILSVVVLVVIIGATAN